MGRPEPILTLFRLERILKFGDHPFIVLCEDTRERGVCETLVRLRVRLSVRHSSVRLARLARLFIERESKRFYRETNEWQRERSNTMRARMEHH